jgi:hypothetical protein
MGMRVRLGPVSLSSRGRVGVHAGPVSFYGGGSRGRSSDAPGAFAVLLGFGLLAIAVMWPLSLWGHAIHLTPSWHQLMHRNHHWLHHHYPLVGLRYIGAFVVLVVALVLAARPFLGAFEQRAQEREQRAAAAAAEQRRQAELAHQQWLASPPPPLLVPGRFTQRWIAENVPSLHPGQVPALRKELRARGWTDDKIALRVEPYLP